MIARCIFHDLGKPICMTFAALEMCVKFYDFSGRPCGTHRSWNLRGGRQKVDLRAQQQHFRIPETDSRGLETEPGGLETELGVHRIHDRLDHIGYMIDWITGDPSQLGGPSEEGPADSDIFGEGNYGFVKLKNGFPDHIW